MLHINTKNKYTVTNQVLDSRLTQPTPLGVSVEAPSAVKGPTLDEWRTVQGKARAFFWPQLRKPNNNSFLKILMKGISTWLMEALSCSPAKSAAKLMLHNESLLQEIIAHLVFLKFNKSVNLITSPVLWLAYV